MQLSVEANKLFVKLIINCAFGYAIGKCKFERNADTGGQSLCASTELVYCSELDACLRMECVRNVLNSHHTSDGNCPPETNYCKDLDECLHVCPNRSTKHNNHRNRAQHENQTNLFNSHAKNIGSPKIVDTIINSRHNTRTQTPKSHINFPLLAITITIDADFDRFVHRNYSSTKAHVICELSTMLCISESVITDFSLTHGSVRVHFNAPNTRNVRRNLLNRNITLTDIRGKRYGVRKITAFALNDRNVYNNATNISSSVFYTVDNNSSQQSNDNFGETSDKSEVIELTNRVFTHNNTNDNISTEFVNVATIVNSVSTEMSTNADNSKVTKDDTSDDNVVTTDATVININENMSNNSIDLSTTAIDIEISNKNNNEFSTERPVPQEETTVSNQITSNAPQNIDPNNNPDSQTMPTIVSVVQTEGIINTINEDLTTNIISEEVATVAPTIPAEVNTNTNKHAFTKSIELSTIESNIQTNIAIVTNSEDITEKSTNQELITNAEQTSQTNSNERLTTKTISPDLTTILTELSSVEPIVTNNQEFTTKPISQEMTDNASLTSAEPVNTELTTKSLPEITTNQNHIQSEAPLITNNEKYATNAITQDITTNEPEISANIPANPETENQITETVPQEVITTVSTEKPTTSQSSTPTTGAKVSTRKSTQDYVPLSFKINHNYELVVNIGEQSFVEQILPQLADHLRLPFASLVDMRVKSGSILVEFYLVAVDGPLFRVTSDSLRYAKEEFERRIKQNQLFLNISGEKHQLFPVSSTNASSVSQCSNGSQNWFFSANGYLVYGLAVGALMTMIVVVVVTACAVRAYMNNKLKRQVGPKKRAKLIKTLSPANGSQVWLVNGDIETRVRDTLKTSERRSGDSGVCIKEGVESMTDNSAVVVPEPHSYLPPNDREISCTPKPPQEVIDKLRKQWKIDENLLWFGSQSETKNII